MPYSLKNILEETGAKPLKSLGQNFLINKKILDDIALAANLSKKDAVLEIGPGMGNLTRVLAKKCQEVIAFEIDKKIFKILEENTKKLKNVKVFNEDVKKVNLEAILKGKKYKVVANIPYYLTSFIIRKLFSLKNKPKLIVFLVQKEVARRILAKPPHMNLLALSVQFFSEPKIVKAVKRGNFWPVPKVDSAIILLKAKTEEEIVRQSPEIALKLAKIGFSSKRKQLKNNLKKGLKIDEKTVISAIKKMGMNEKVRPEELSVENWKNLSSLINE